MVNHPSRRAAAKRKTAVQSEPEHNHEHDYSALLIGVRASFDAIVASHRHLFLTDVDGLNDLYLDSLPGERQVHNCHSCRRFIGTFGKVVAINDAGEIVSAMWNPESVPEFYHAAFAAMFAKANRARVKAVFASNQSVWGTPITGAWSHIAVLPPAAMVYRGKVLTAGQAMAASKENYKTVATALSEFSAPMLDEALRLLQADALVRSEKFIGPVKWLRALHDRPKGRAGEHILWAAIASAPEGYCHPKASVIGPLLDDIVAGLAFADIKARFDAKMHPLIYQRPQVAPSAGNIKAAEAIVEKLGIARSLDRRFARIEEVQTLWSETPLSDAPKGGGVFGHLKAKDSAAVKPVDMPAMTMTWDKFTRTVLPRVERMQVHVPHLGNFMAYLTSEHADAPLILKWDNPVSAYVYNGRSHAAQWNLVPNAWATVVAISPHPNLWVSPKPHLGDGLNLIIEGAVDTRTDSGNALFPETLRDDLHAVRATIEAFSKRAVIGRPDGQLACGLGIGKGVVNCILRVFAGGAWTPYLIDRWD